MVVRMWMPIPKGCRLYTQSAQLGKFHPNLYQTKIIKWWIKHTKRLVLGCSLPSRWYDMIWSYHHTFPRTSPITIFMITSHQDPASGVSLRTPEESCPGEKPRCRGGNKNVYVIYKYYKTCACKTYTHANTYHIYKTSCTAYCFIH